MLIVETHRKTERNGGADMVCLSTRDLQLAHLVSHGRQNKEIAGILGITEGTVKVYMSHLFAKLGLFNRADLSAWAVRHGHEIGALAPVSGISEGDSVAESGERDAAGPDRGADAKSKSRFWKLYAAS